MEQGTSEWLSWRNKGLGSSDASTILGINGFKDLFQLWLEKTGRSKGDMPNYAMSRGTAMEPLAREIYFGRALIPLKPRGARTFNQV
jgi:putative phage-type endonuclease